MYSIQDAKYNISKYFLLLTKVCDVITLINDKIKIKEELTT